MCYNKLTKTFKALTLMNKKSSKIQITQLVKKTKLQNSVEILTTSDIMVNKSKIAHSDQPSKILKYRYNSNENLSQPNVADIDNHERIVLNQKCIPLYKHCDAKKFVQLMDMDSLFGHLTFDEFKNLFLGNVKLDINNSEHYYKMSRISTNYNILVNSSYIGIKKLPHVKIGTSFKAEIRTLDLYIVISNNKTTINSESLKKLIYNSINTSIKTLGLDAPSSFFNNPHDFLDRQSGVYSERNVFTISNKDFMLILDNVINIVLEKQQPLIYFDTRGNKKLTITTDLSVNTLKEKIHTMFKPEIIKHCIIDQCISNSFGEGTVTVPTIKYYEDMCIKPNYTLYFRDTINNLYINTMNNKTNKLTQVGDSFHC